MKVTRYKRRHWAVYDTEGALICVCVYRKGAENVARLLQAHNPLSPTTETAEGGASCS